MYWRRFRLSDIPIDNDAAFAMWLKNRWTEKDYLLEHFTRHGAFPESDPVKAMQTEAALQKLANANGNGEKKTVIKPVVKTAKFITTEVKAGGMEEFLAIFAPITAAATAMSGGELSPENIDFDALLNKVAQQQQLNLLKTGAAPKTSRTNEGMRQALFEASKSMAGGKPIQGSTIEEITRNAAQQQKDMFDAMTKTGLPKTNRPTDGKKLDPAMQRMIENAHEETRRRLLRASNPTAKSAPDVRKAIPMTPMNTIITRPISTIAVQRARQHVQRAAASRQSQPSKTVKQATNAGKAQASTKAPNKLPDAKKSSPQTGGKSTGKPNGKLNEASTKKTEAVKKS